MPKVAKPSGFLVTFEGTEGAGKSTLIRTLGAQLEASGMPVVATREPGGSEFAEKIRELVLSEGMDPRAELFLYEAARAEHLAKTIHPALGQGRVVLCDRFTDSSLAYQGHARGLPWKEVEAANRIATAGLKPGLTVLLDIDPAVGLSRAQDPNRFEAEGVEFQKKVRQGFLKARKADPKRWIVLPARAKTPEQLADAVMKEILKRWKGKRRG